MRITIRRSKKRIPLPYRNNEKNVCLDHENSNSIIILNMTTKLTYDCFLTVICFQASDVPRRFLAEEIKNKKSMYLYFFCSNHISVLFPTHIETLIKHKQTNVYIRILYTYCRMLRLSATWSCYDLHNLFLNLINLSLDTQNSHLNVWPQI